MKEGFSLIELIIALALILVAIMIFGVALSSLPLTKTARDQNIAYHIAAGKFEELRNTPFADLPASGSFTDAGFVELRTPTGNLVIVNYEGSTFIKKATVTVSWEELGQTKSVVLETLISENGLNQQ